MAHEMPQEEGQLHPTAFSRMLGDAGDRIQGVLQATDRTTHEVLEEANVAARRCLDDAYERSQRLAGERMEKLASVSQELLAQAATIQQKIYELNQVVDENMITLAGEFGIENAPAPQRTMIPEPERAPSAGPPDPGPPNGDPPSKRGLIGRRKKQGGSGKPTRA